jgi:DNA repair photolyase
MFYHPPLFKIKFEMIIREILARNILSRSKVFEYALNPYVGCRYACTYCYARFMKRFTGHREPWGAFVDVKVNAPELLEKEIKKKKAGRVWISGVCDPYQPAERKYALTRRCLAVLVQHNWPVTIQTKSPLVTRDLDLLKGATDVEVGLTITTADENVRKIFEPKAPPVEDRIGALGALHSEGVRTFAMIAPVLPGAERLAGKLKGKAAYVLIDRMNYHYADRVYRKHGMERAMKEEFFTRLGEELKDSFERAGVPCEVLF